MKYLLSILLTAILITGCGIQPPVAAPPASASQSSAADRVASAAVWAQGELAEHFDKHPETYKSRDEYDTGARDTIRNGSRFTYVDTQSRAPRVGYYESSTNRFTGMTGDERRITTHFRPDRGAAYVRGLPSSTYR